MKQDYYHYFNNKVHNQRFSLILTEIVYFIDIIIFLIKKAKCKKNIVDNISVENAKSFIENIQPKPNIGDLEVIDRIDSNIDLSIVIPVYNYEKVLRECLNSAINQITNYNYEIIIIDDGATDSSSKIVDEYSNFKNVKIIHQKNKGISFARNIGLNNARGKYIMFLDCDDIISNSIVEKMLNEAYKTGNDIIECGYYYFISKNNVVEKKKYYVSPASNLKHESRDIINYPGWPWGKIYKRKLFENLRFPVNYWFEDTIIQFLLFRRCTSFSYIPDVLYKYRVYENNFTKVQKKSIKSVDHYWIIEYCIELSKKLNIKDEKLLYVILIRHAGPYLCNGTKFMNEEVRKNLFVLAAKIVNDNKPKERYKLSYMEKILEKCYKSLDFNLWNLACQYID